MANLFPEGHANTSLEDLINKLLGTMNAASQLVLVGAFYDTNQIDSTRASDFQL
ncbi:hypothetical protein CROQUDRAFT_101651 [Cronartium quercuum f. sp. fusiforme G11]|uniref:Uncharacterized protein n=1 Tax=Cronartium quercuum f. sp. fusiforme G11 TaxID=708437 RepID=A0A9P6N7U4_9BASI|nr:hypothetical protein CROQUDRAFT_101651 [Cronartium quercuum f. sp. fusiforme G11]